MIMRQKLRSGILIVMFVLFPVTFMYFSPYLIIMGASEGVITGSFIVFVVLFLVALFAGRIFCSWVCPLAGIQEHCATARPKKANNRLNWVRYVIWVPWLGIIIYMAIRAGGFKSVDFAYQTLYGVSVRDIPSLIMYLMVVIITLVLSFAVGKRALCHYVCWINPFMVAGRKLGNILKIPSLRLRADKAICNKCGKCSKACTMSLDVMEMVQTGKMENSECILCGKCVDICPKGVIKYTFQRGKGSF
jgi:ferredoxin-type protein NapH